MASQERPKPAGSRQTPRAVYLDGRQRRTTVRMEPVMWDALREIAAYEGLSISQVVARVNENRDADENLSSAIRVYIVQFYRSRARL